MVVDPATLLDLPGMDKGGSYSNLKCLRRDRLSSGFAIWAPALAEGMFANAGIGCCHR